MKHLMTVGKLIERLSKYDRDTPVCVRGHDHVFATAYQTDSLAVRGTSVYDMCEAELGDEEAFTVVVIE